jgi:hypothetical protein
MRDPVLRCLDIDVPRELVARWAGWFAPPTQPFLTDPVLLARLGMAPSGAALPAELRDTFEVYGSAAAVVWLDEATFAGLPRRHRAALVRAQVARQRGVVPSVRGWAGLLGRAARDQADGHRFVWWPSLLAGHEDRILTAYVSEGRRPSRHDEVPDATWAAASRLLPGARSLAGTFADRSGPNCFGTVMAAAGVPGADLVWMLREPFEQWLSETTRSGGCDGEPGTVLVWRSPDGLVQHAAVTIGDGWALHKPSQGWMSPRKALTVRDVLRSARAAGRRLERHTLAG